MNICDWPLGRIMQLPDSCFGRRFMISCSAYSANTVPGWDIAEIAFPERCVIWDLFAYTDKVDVSSGTFRLALGDQLPTATAMVDVLEPLFPGLGRQGAEPRQIAAPFENFLQLRKLRMPILAAGRRFVLEVTSVAPLNWRFLVMLVVSSFPTEVPEWLISGPGRSP